MDVLEIWPKVIFLEWAKLLHINGKEPYLGSIFCFQSREKESSWLKKRMWFKRRYFHSGKISGVPIVDCTETFLPMLNLLWSNYFIRENLKKTQKTPENSQKLVFNFWITIEGYVSSYWFTDIIWNILVTLWKISLESTVWNSHHVYVKVQPTFKSFF